ncbi:MAG TPA: aldo/keto reductase [Acidobacteriaceae bacterium]|nr:aldo/keto reductase [Acidobacteriaceae bacterium]
MERVKLGKSELQVPTICLGGNVFGWTVSEADSFRQLDAALEAGLNFIDTADVYSRWAPGHQGGESEAILGKWMATGNKRSNVILATKVGIDMGEGKKGLKPAYIQQAVEDSLRRLQTDYIDLYQAHKDDEETPLEETLAAFDKLVQQGKVLHIGASNYSGARLAKALRVSKDNGLVSYICLQPQYNLVEREHFETDLLPVVQEHTLGVIPYYSLAAGFLTGKYRTKEDAEGKVRAVTVKKYLNDWGFQVIKVLDEVAKQHHSTPARVALAWLMVQPGVTAPIASATSEKHLTDLIEATKLTLDHASLQKLTAVSTPATTAKT